MNLPEQIKTTDKLLTNKLDIVNALNDHYVNIGQQLSKSLNKGKETETHNYKKLITNSIFLPN